MQEAAAIPKQLEAIMPGIDSGRPKRGESRALHETSFHGRCRVRAL